MITHSYEYFLAKVNMSICKLCHNNINRPSLRRIERLWRLKTCYLWAERSFLAVYFFNRDSRSTTAAVQPSSVLCLSLVSTFCRVSQSIVFHVYSNVIVPDVIVPNSFLNLCVGFLVSIAYIDPGNFETDLQAGAQFRYQLIWYVLPTTPGSILQKTWAQNFLGVEERRACWLLWTLAYSRPFCQKSIFHWTQNCLKYLHIRYRLFSSTKRGLSVGCILIMKIRFRTFKNLQNHFWKSIKPIDLTVPLFLFFSFWPGSACSWQRKTKKHPANERIHFCACWTRGKGITHTLGRETWSIGHTSNSSSRSGTAYPHARMCVSCHLLARMNGIIYEG